MIEQAPRVAREFHVGPAGDRWALSRDLTTGQPYVLHRPGEDEPEVQLELGSFLVLFQGQERDDLLRLIASLLPHDEPAAHNGDHDGGHEAANVVRPLRFVSRWMPGRQN
jgi:hypothetical protein